MCLLSIIKVSQFYLALEQSQKFFYSQNLYFVSVKKFLTWLHCMIKFLFLVALQENIFTIISQCFTILVCIGGTLEFSLVSIIGFCENEKLLSQGVWMLKFLFLEGIQRHVFAITHQSFTILVCIGVVLEFYFVFNGYKSVY